MKSSSTSFFYSIGCLILFQVVVLSTANAQGCNLKTGVLAFACTEGTSLSYEDGIDCYSEIRMILDAGTFYEWTANAADGWIVEQVAPSELLVTHMNGTFPSGDHTMVDFLYYTPGGAPAQLILLYPDECVMEGCENQHTLPGCGEGCITGTVYRECADEPLSNQLTLDGFLVELFDEMGNIISEYTTGSDGAYSTCNLPPGNYVVRATRDPGWTPKVPPTGMYAVELTPGMDLVRDFGSCPSCTCDDLEIILQQEITENDTAFLNLYLYYSEYPPCVFRYELTLDSGEIIGIEHIPDGWEAEIINPQLAVLQQSESFDDWTTFVFHRGRVAIDYGIKEKGIKATVRLIGDGNQPPEPVCIDSIIIEDPTKFKQLTCCPEGSILGAELVLNGEFLVVQAPASDYSYLPYPNYPGEIAIVNHVTSPYWLQISKNGGPFDHFLAVNGSTNQGQAVWKQQVTGLLGEKDYNFCGLFNNLFKSNLNADDPVIELVIQDDISSSKWSSGLILLPENPDIWEKLSVAWTTPAVTSPSYTLKILSHGTNPFGNDFGVDCISFRECIAPPKDTCCKDNQAFCDDLEAGIVFSADFCKVTMDLGALLPCYAIEWVDWGQGPEYGPWTPSTFPRPMHTFSGNGTYPISYLAIAYNDSNFICLEKVIMDTITVQCEPCICNVPNMSITTNLESFQMFCSPGVPTPMLPCPASEVNITGFFGCETASGALCDETVVNYLLTGPNGIVDQGVTTPFPSLTYSVSQIGAPGTYTLTVSTLCPGQIDSCECTLQWIQEDCDTCYCGGFTDMFIRTPQGAMNIAIACGDPPLTIACPDPGKGFHLTGVFDCIGGACPSDHQIDWTLTHQSLGTTHTGGFQDNDPYFGIHILPTYISQPGIYTLTMTGYCNGDTCVCEVQFVIDCPDLCPCDMEDILALSANVDKGFAVALANKSCKACFSPLAVSDCETVEWYVGSTSGTPIGTSIGAQTFCFTFPFSGTYTIYMVVTRLKPDGTLCEAFVYSKTITVSCIKSWDCAHSIWPNPGFSEGAVACMTGADGESEGWVGEGPSLAVLEGVEGSDDAWSVLLTGCYFTSDRLAAIKPVCTSREDKGTLVLRIRSSTPNACCASCRPPLPSKIGNKLIITIDDGQNVGCKAQKGCLCIAEIEDLFPIEDDDWYDVYIPYDLSEWEPTDSCGDESLGSPARLNIWMSNMLSSDQGDGNVRDAVIIDHICMGGTLVGTDNPPSSLGYRLFPNPTLDAFRIELPYPAMPNTSMHVIGLTGQILLNQLIPEGILDHVVNAGSLAPGMYFVEVIQNGKRAAVFKVVKQ
ncbi:T9SS type A sorting domain-containing protein [Aquiflexum sp.]|uniref:T9SS type A sorting domain-containing protein n=1 Tax=Aquiflexum sp. TaxID=1872584 RepID=UPI0035939FCC